jgi:hypothetical protein
MDRELHDRRGVRRRSPRSALGAAQVGEDLGRRLGPGGEIQRLAEILEHAGRRLDLTRGAQCRRAARSSPDDRSGLQPTFSRTE